MTNQISIRPYKSSGLAKLIQLFKDAVNAISIKHYSQEQIDAWTIIDARRWEQSFAKNITLVAYGRL